MPSLQLSCSLISRSVLQAILLSTFSFLLFQVIRHLQLATAIVGGKATTSRPLSQNPALLLLFKTPTPTHVLAQAQQYFSDARSASCTISQDIYNVSFKSSPPCPPPPHPCRLGRVNVCSPYETSISLAAGVVLAGRRSTPMIWCPRLA